MIGIVTGYGLDDRMIGVRFPAGAGNFSLRPRVQTGSGAHPASYPVGNRGSFLGVKRPRREADHSPPPTAEVKKNEWIYTSTPPIRLHGVALKLSTGTSLLSYIVIQLVTYILRVG
jgi:hypothetical protein